MAQPRFFQSENNASAENKSQNITIPSAQHWKNLQTRVDQFNALEMKSNKLDEIRFQEIHLTMIEIIKNGMLGENSNFLAKPFIINSALSQHNLFENNVFHLPVPAGAKSLAFIQSVYLPYLKDSRSVIFTSDNYIGQTTLHYYSYLNQFFFNQRIGDLTTIINQFRENNPEAAANADAIIDKIMPAITIQSSSTENKNDNAPGLSK